MSSDPGAASPAEAAALVRDGDEVFLDTSRPPGVADALAARTDLADVRVYAYGYPYEDPGALVRLAETPGVDLRVSMAAADLRSRAAGDVGYLPRALSAVARRPFVDADRRSVALLRTAPADGRTLSLGCHGTFGERLVGLADLSVAETDPGVPVPERGRSVPVDAVDCVVPGGGPLPRLDVPEGDETAAAVAENAAGLVPDGATIQVGIGRVARALWSELLDADVAVRTGMLGPGARRFVAANPAASVTACVALGPDAAFYEWVDGVDGVTFVPPTTSHDRAALERERRFTAVNAALQVDLAGAVDAETVDGRPVAGVGGQPDFLAAASASPDGRSIVALPARAGSSASRIVPGLAGDDAVTTPRYAVDAVATEYGVARLGGRSVAERAEGLIEVAHPDDRPALRSAAAERGPTR